MSWTAELRQERQDRIKAALADIEAKRKELRIPVARFCRYCKFDRVTYWRWVQGRTTPPPKKWRKFCDTANRKLHLLEQHYVCPV